ncbi:MAG: CDP-diacylglycerol--glycerol-3-phosphate 3-phosphatidyltransferase [Actinomycetota bacterium]|nr:CDP-diacylglycerol--glycerol-3-phosphate 3-phosphatidyltransferase [Actinomycetota bacterium]
MSAAEHEAVPAQAPIVNPANALTLLRLLLVPVFVMVLFHADGTDPMWRLAACAVFVFASITDHVDGNLARSRNLITDVGKIADPIADKALTGAAFIGLSMLAELPWWVTITVLTREIGVTLLRFWVIRHGVIAASPGGKLKTLLQFVALTAYLLPLTGLLATGRAVVMAAAVVVTVATGLDYVVRALAVRRNSERTMAKRAREAGR